MKHPVFQRISEGLGNIQELWKSNVLLQNWKSRETFCEQWLYAFAYDSLFCRDCACDVIGWITFLLCCKIFPSRCCFTLHAYLALCQSSTSRAFVWSQSSYTGCSLLDVIYHLNLQYLLITDITAGIGRGGGGSGDSGCWLVSHLHDIETP